MCIYVVCVLVKGRLEAILVLEPRAYVCMYICMSVCVYVCVYVRGRLWAILVLEPGVYVCMYVCVCVGACPDDAYSGTWSVCMYACMYVCVTSWKQAQPHTINNLLCLDL